MAVAAFWFAPETELWICRPAPHIAHYAMYSRLVNISHDIWYLLVLRGSTLDTICSRQRSALMARIKGKNTMPELVVRRIAHGLGYRFRLHRRSLPGAPDLVFPKLRRAIFVHGCFWHQHIGCRRSNVPKSRTEYWTVKLARNVARDRVSVNQLRRLGWRVAIIWECETERPDGLEARIARFLAGPL